LLLFPLRSASLCILSTLCGLLAAYCLLCAPYAFADDLKLQDLIDIALKNNPELLVSESIASASAYRIPQAKSLPDPMFMFGYQNEGWNKYTYGEMQGAQWMFSASQMIPFPGKMGLKGEMSERETESLRASRDSVRLKTIARVKELYYDLFLAYKDIDLINDKSLLFRKTEDAAFARYSAGMGTQEEVLMAQTEKYMLLEKEEMLKQKIQSYEAMLNATLGRDVNHPLGRPVEMPSTPYKNSLDMLIRTALENSPEIKSREKMVAAADAKVKMAKKEYFPDFTMNAGYFSRGGGQFEDMWSLTTTVNIPIYYRSKQKQAVLETEASLSGARYELEGTKVMITSGIRDNYSMIVTAEKLMELYKNGLIPKISQDFELALSNYGTGKVEAITVITRLKSLFDFEFLYWEQFTGREKAIARLEAITGVDQGLSVMEKR
jgi:cobalt-zinc-cadmium efflux system outer membrane protein